MQRTMTGRGLPVSRALALFLLLCVGCSPESSQLQGRVVIRSFAIEWRCGGPRLETPFVGEVILTSTTGTQRVRTDEQGHFTATGDPGPYDVSVVEDGKDPSLPPVATVPASVELGGDNDPLLLVQRACAR